jgi:hypothetical protein
MGEAKRRRAREAEQHATLTAGIAQRLNPPEPYAHMTVQRYWEMLEGEDPDDRAIREAHGIGYEEDFGDLAVMCRYGCGATYHEIASSKMRACAARPENGDEVSALLSPGRVFVTPPDAVTPEMLARLNAEVRP